MTAKNAQELHDLYTTQRLGGDDVRNLDTNPMSKGYPQLVKSRVADMMNIITNGTMPFIQWETTKETYAKGVNRWSEDFVFPRSLWAPLAKEDVQQECHTAINNVLLPVKETEKNRQPPGRCACTHGTPVCRAQVDPGVHCEADTLRPNVPLLHKLGCSSPAKKEKAFGSCTPSPAAGFWTAPTRTRATSRGHADSLPPGPSRETSAHQWTARAGWGNPASASRPTRRTTGARCPAEPRRPAHPTFGKGCGPCGRERRR